MKTETVGFIGAAQRLGVSKEEVEKLVKEKKIKEVSRGRISLESLYAYSGFKAGAKQTSGGGAGRRPNVMSFDEAAKYLGVSMGELKVVIDRGDIEVADGAKGVRGPREAMVKMYKKKMDSREKAVSPDESENKAEAKAKKQEDQNKEPVLEETKDAAGRKDAAADTEQCAADNEARCNDEPDTKTKDDDPAGERAGASLNDVMQELFAGTVLNLMSKEMREEALESERGRTLQYDRRDMKEVADVAYKMGRLSAFEELFSREYVQLERAVR